jgi:hypothetical protein
MGVARYGRVWFGRVWLMGLECKVRAWLGNAGIGKDRHG